MRRQQPREYPPRVLTRLLFAFTFCQALAAAATDVRESIPLPTAEIFERMLRSAEAHQLDATRVQKSVDLLRPLVDDLNRRYRMRVDKDLDVAIADGAPETILAVVKRLITLSIRSQLDDARRVATDRAEATAHLRGAYVEPARFARAGFNAYLVKPLKVDELHGALSLAWMGHQGQRPSGLITRHTVREARSQERQERAKEHEAFRARVLLAEDNIVNQKVAAIMLRKLGCRVDVAANGREALAMLEMIPYDVVFMDCEMPELDGYSATGEIRRREGGGRRIPIVAMTAHAMAGEQERCLAAGMDDYVSKPIREAVLGAALARWAARTVPTPCASDQTMRTDGTTVLDPDVLASLRELGLGDSGRPVVDELLDSCAKRIGDSIAEMRCAVDAADAERLARLAHFVRGSSGVVGAHQITRLVADLEQVGRSGSVSDSESLINRLETELSRMVAEIERVRHRNAGSGSRNGH